MGVGKHDKAVHAHPFSILLYLWRFLFLLIIPLARGFLSAVTGGLIAWLYGAWVDILIVGLIITLAYQKWAQFKYYMDKSGIYYTSGILFRSKTFIPMRSISTLSSLKAFWLRPLGVVKLRVDSIARDPAKADLEFYVRAEDAERMMGLRRAPAVERGGIAAEFHPNMLSIMFLSLFTSNSFIGIVFIAAFISQAGQILGTELSELLLTTFEQLSRKVAFGLPPVLAGVAVALLVGWLVAFTYNLLQAKNLYTRRTDATLHVGGGVLIEREYSLHLDDISFVDIRQSLLTRLLRLYSVFVNAVGFGKDKSDIAAIVPFSAKKRAFKMLSLLLPEYKAAPRQLKPNAGAIFKFIIDPLWPCALIPLATIVVSWFLPSWIMMIRFVGFMLLLPALWFLGVRLVDFFSSGVSRSGDYYTLRYSKFYYLHTAIFSKDKIALVNIRQSILQRGDKKCDLVVSTRAEGRSRHHIRNLDWDPCARIFDAVEKSDQA